MNELAVSTITFRALDLASALDWIAAEGYTTVDLALIPRFCPHADPVALDDAGRQRLRGLFDARGLRAATMNTWSLTALNGPAGPAVELAWLRASLKLAVALGCRAISAQPGRKAEPEAWLSQARLVTGHLDQIGREAADLGVQLLVEAPHMGTLAQTFDQALDFLDLLGTHVGVTLDSSHIRNGGATLARALGEYAGRVKHTHLRDYGDGSINVTPGDGDIDYGAFFVGLRRHAYRGDFALELEYPNATMEDCRAELRRAAAHLRPLMIGKTTLA
ncbi:MAG TPA: sugar phosphate isomerase/epimerase [Thermoflexales bacterium]|nr:sugar phosphate isomerase/epimerase [Thermoflexales bacterium]HQX10393.1 sugar phosphate isomerase/epimerase [Thermoflexales bacterium]HQZ53383.1 sugar phosphate isomerase/epimerase [Thermoflexales bacterium]